MPPLPEISAAKIPASFDRIAQNAFPKYRLSDGPCEATAEAIGHLNLAVRDRPKTDSIGPAKTVLDPAFRYNGNGFRYSRNGWAIHRERGSRYSGNE